MQAFKANGDRENLRFLSDHREGIRLLYKLKKGFAMI